MQKNNISARFCSVPSVTSAHRAFQVNAVILMCAAISTVVGCDRRVTISDEADVIRARNESQVLDATKELALEEQRINFEREKLRENIRSSNAIERERIQLQREQLEAEKLDAEEQRRKQAEFDRLRTTEVELAAAKQQIGLWASGVLRNADRKRAEKKQLESFVQQCDEAETELSNVLSMTRVVTTNINKSVVGSKTLVFTNIVVRAVSGDVQYKLLHDAISKAPKELTPKLALAMDELKQAMQDLAKNTATESQLARANTDAVTSYENRWHEANNNMLAARLAASKQQKRLDELETELKQTEDAVRRRIKRLNMRETWEIRQDINTAKSIIATESHKAQVSENRLGDISSATAAHRANTQRDSFNSQRLTDNTIQDNMRQLRSSVLNILIDAKSEKRAKMAVIDNELEAAADLKESFSQLNPEQILRIRDRLSIQTERRLINAVGE